VKHTKTYSRFEDLKQRGVVSSRSQLTRWQKLYGFPTGKLVAPNTRIYEDREVEEWIASCPADERKPLGGAAKASHERKTLGTARNEKEDSAAEA
jgi:hypothetical protein